MQTLFWVLFCLLIGAVALALRWGRYCSANTKLLFDALQRYACEPPEKPPA